MKIRIQNKNQFFKFPGFYERLVSNSKSGDIKVMISLGGWTDSAGDKYSKLISNGSNRKKYDFFIVNYWLNRVPNKKKIKYLLVVVS